MRDDDAHTGAPTHMERIGYRFPFALVGVKGAAPATAALMTDKTKFLVRIDATVQLDATSGAVTLADVQTEKTDITTAVILKEK